jgi:hypothetical protein
LRRLALALALLLAAVRPARGQDSDQNRSILVHPVRKGDDLELLAAEYYADRRYAVFIMFMNGMTHPRNLKPGERLKIPTAWRYSAASRETLDMLAERFLGDGRRAQYLAEFNGMPVTGTLSSGQEVHIPFHIRYVADSNTTLNALAATFYNDGRKADLLRGYNFRGGRVVKKGDSVIIPIIEVRVRPEKLPEPSEEEKRREDKRQEMRGRVVDALPRARDALKEGDYAAVRRALSELEVDYLETEDAVGVSLLLGEAHVAFGDEDSAKANFQKVLERDPDHRLSARQKSPKVRAVWERAGGRVEH